MPDRAAVQRAIAAMRRPVDVEYFFSKLRSPDWIEPLVAEGMFDSPPAAVREGGYVRFPDWPATGYLVRVAAQAPEAAVRALSGIPDTDNERVHVDLATIATVLPPGDAAAWAAKEAKWIARQPRLFLLLPNRIAKLIAYLADAGKIAPALELSRALFAVLPDGRTFEGQAALPPTPIGRCDAWQYSEALRVVVPALAKDGGIHVVRTFANLLNEAVRLSTLDDDAVPPLDYSFIWRDAIELDDDNDPSVRDALVGAVRDAAATVAASGRCREVVELLETYRWNLFRRLALHVLRVACLDEPKVVESRLLIRDAFHDPAIHHEYILLLRDGFPRFSPAEQALVLGWIGEGRDIEDMRERHRVFTGDEATAEQLRAWVEQWQRDRLWPLRDVLPAPWVARLEELVHRHGRAESDLLRHRGTMGAGGGQNLAAPDELRALRGEELRQFLRHWVPSDAPGEPSRRGAAHAIGLMDRSFFEDESAAAERWSELHLAYVADFLTGVERVVRDGGAVHWVSVLRLCRQIAERADTGSDAIWARKKVADLLVVGLDSETHGPSADSSADVWSAIRATIVAEESEGTEPELGGSAVDSVSTAINSTQGKVLEAAIRYAVWVKRHDHVASADWSLRSRLPEVADTLTRLADPLNVRFMAARAMFGLQLDPLFWLDIGWVSANLDRLFPSAPELRQFRDAVWTTFLKHGRPFGQAFDLLRKEYLQAIEEIGSEPAGDDVQRDVQQHVAQHLMVYYWHGFLPLDGEDGLLREFFENAQPKLRLEALQFVGRSLRQNSDLAREVLERLVALLDWRIERIKRVMEPSARHTAAKELSAFGWWFGSGRFDPTWALERLIAILYLGGGVEPDHVVAEQLAHLTDNHPAAVAEAVLLMVESDREGFGPASWQNEAKSILSRLVIDPEPAIRMKAVTAIHALGDRGLGEFRQLLAKPPRAADS